MNKIFKYPLEITRTQKVKMPYGARVLTLQMQGDVPAIWAEVDPNAELLEYTINMYGTGWDMPDNHGRYLGTIVEDYVWHFYML